MTSPPPTGFAVPRPEALSFGRHKEASGRLVSSRSPRKGALPVARPGRIHGSRLQMHDISADE